MIWLVAVLAVLAGASASFAQTPDGGYRVFRPEGAGPLPAVAFVSGCSGFRLAPAAKAYKRAAEQLRGQGYFVLFVDYLGRRGLRTCTKTGPPEAEVAADLVAAVAWLRAEPSVDASRVSAMGWSYGGGAVLVALTDNPAARLGIARAIVYYPVCRAARPWQAATPVLMLLAGDDPVAPTDACRAAAQKSAAPDTVKIVTYHGALQGFDNSDLPAETQGLAGPIGYNPQAAAAAWQEVQRFLAPPR